MDLLEKIEKYHKTALPMHMPGHKRNTDLAPFLSTLSANLDLTEINGFDNLNKANGILKKEMQRTARLFKSEQTFYLVNGSTAGILASVYACVRENDEVICALNSHKSVFNALRLTKAKVHYISPKLNETLGFCENVTLKQVKEATQLCKNAKLLILTSPTYEGVNSSLKEIVEFAHLNKIIVLVDSAHGAHLGFHPAFFESAVSSGADLVIQSVHKTLPSLTQTALLHFNSKLVALNEIKESLSIFQTSSPSYLLMSSISSCTTLLEERAYELFEELNLNLNNFYKKVKELKHLKVLPKTSSRDFTKIIVSTQNTKINAAQLAKTLRTEFNIEIEMASLEYLICITTIADKKENFELLLNALFKIDSVLTKREKNYSFIPSDRIFTTNIANAKASTSEIINLCDSVGKISHNFIWAYPPGIPILIPGEEITSSTIDLIGKYKQMNLNLESDSFLDLNQVQVIK